jgi:hypothetical protein
VNQNSRECSSSTRGLFGGGNPVTTNVIDILRFQQLGSALDFGDLTLQTLNNWYLHSPTRGVFFRGEPDFTSELIM